MAVQPSLLIAAYGLQKRMGCKVIIIGGFRGGGGGACGPRPSPLISADYSVFVKKFVSANYKSLDFGPRCLESTYLAL